MIYPL